MGQASMAVMEETWEAEHVSLHVRYTNRAAFTLYSQTLGFEIHDIEKGYYADKEDAYDMRKMLTEGIRKQEERKKSGKKKDKDAPKVVEDKAADDKEKKEEAPAKDEEEQCAGGGQEASEEAKKKKRNKKGK